MVELWGQPFSNLILNHFKFKQTFVFLLFLFSSARVWVSMLPKDQNPAGIKILLDMLLDLRQATWFAKQLIEISKLDMTFIIQCRKTLLATENTLYIKKNK